MDNDNATDQKLVIPLDYALKEMKESRILFDLNKKLYDFYNKQEAPTLILDSQNIICPVILLPYEDQTFLLDDGKSAIEIKLEDIKSWSMGSPYMRGTVRPNPNSFWWKLTLAEDSITPNSRVFRVFGRKNRVFINSSLLAGNEESITDFVRPFLSVPIPRFSSKLIVWLALLIFIFISFYTLNGPIRLKHNIVQNNKLYNSQ